MHHIPKLAVAAALALSPLAATAGVAQLQTDGGSVTSVLEYDASRVRMNQQGGYLLTSNAGSWFVMDDGGQPMVMDMAQMRQFMGGRTPSGGLGDLRGTSTLRDTGRDETVAGMRGDVYIVSYTDERGQRRDAEAVLSSDSRARGLSAAFMQMSSAMARSLGQPDSAQSFSAMLGRADKGVLRFGDSMRVVSVSDQSVPSSRLKLPANAQQMPSLGQFGGMGDLFSGSGQQGRSDGAQEDPTSSSGFGGRFGGFLGDQVQRQKDRAETRTEGEIEAETDEATDKLLDKALNKLFGG